jgi:hypothetical protein
VRLAGAQVTDLAGAEPADAGGADPHPAAEGQVGSGFLAGEEDRRRTVALARTFVALFLDELWKPFDEAGRPDEDWPKMIAAVERLRPIAVEALVATFRLNLTEEIDKAFGEVLERARKK